MICEHFKKDYKEATRETIQDNKAYFMRVWMWTCYECGQRYYEKVKEPINLDEENT